MTDSNQEISIPNESDRHTPVISVVIPSLQEGKYIRRTLTQLTPDVRKRFQCEVIVSDGGSTDDTVGVANELADSVVVHDRPGRQTIAAGRNRGAEHAKGSILVFLNADTVIENPADFFPGVLKMFSAEHTHGRVAGATCSVCIYPEEERVVDIIFHNFFNYYFWILNHIGLGMARGECHILRREIFEKVGGYDESLVAGEDFDLFVRLRRLGSIRFIRHVKVFESPRRFRRYGYRRILWLWFLNGISVLFRGRSISSEWEPIR